MSESSAIVDLPIRAVARRRFGGRAAAIIAAAALAASAITAALAAPPAAAPTDDANAGATNGGLATRPERRNLFLITLDTTRRDAMGFLGRSPSITPHLDALAAVSAVFTDAYTVAPLTLPAHTSLLTGLYPNSHHLRDNSVAALAPEATTLAEALSAEGWRATADVAAIVLDSCYGLDQGFATYRDPPRDPGRQRLFIAEQKADVMVDQALRDLPAADGAAPWFEWLHLFDAHYPYAAPGSAPRPARTEEEAYADRRRLYFEEIAWLDAQVGRLLDALRARADWERTVVVVTADHGESLLDGVEPTHGWFVYDPTMRVPLLLRIPGAAPRRLDPPVSLVDVMPTLLELLGVARPDLRFDGESLAPLLAAAPPASDVLDAYAGRAVALESWYAWSNFGWAPMEACVQGGLKFIRSRRERLYDRGPGGAGERGDGANVLREDDVRARGMRARLDQWATAPAQSLAAQGVTLDDAERAELATLGYVAGSSRDLAARPDFATLDDPEDHAEVVFLLEQVTSRFAEGNAAGAAVELRRLCELAPQSVFAHEQLGAFLIAGGRKEDWDEAEHHLRKALEIDFQRAKAHYNLGLLTMRRMNAAKVPAEALKLRRTALIELRLALEIDKNSPEALANFASLGRMEADQMDPADPVARLALYDEVLAAADRFLAELPPTHADRARFEAFRTSTAAARAQVAQAAAGAPGR